MSEFNESEKISEKKKHVRKCQQRLLILLISDVLVSRDKNSILL